MRFTAADGSNHEVIFGTPINFTRYGETEEVTKWDVLIRFPDWHENHSVTVQGTSAEEAREQAEQWVRENLDFYVALHRPGGDDPGRTYPSKGERA